MNNTHALRCKSDNERTTFGSPSKADWRFARAKPLSLRRLRPATRTALVPEQPRPVVLGGGAFVRGLGLAPVVEARTDIVPAAARPRLRIFGGALFDQIGVLDPNRKSAR